MIPEGRKRKNTRLYEPEPFPIQFERDRKKKKTKKETEMKALRLEYRSRWASNLKRYKELDINGKIKFARAGYKFPDQKEIPAIVIEKSSIRIRGGLNRGVMAFKLFSALPVGFVILFSKLRIADVPEVGTLQAKYQVGIIGNKVLQTHTCEKPPYGLAQIVNHPVKKNAKRKTDPLLHKTKQNMLNANCELRNNKGSMSEKNFKDFPAYLIITKRVPLGHEVLYNYGNSYRL
jgi:hypothetical protein